MPKQYFLLKLFFIVLISSPLIGQMEEAEFHYGFTAGVSLSQIQDINTTLIRPIFPVDSYNTNTKAKPGFTGGAFIYYKFKNSDFAIQPEITYADMGSMFNYSDINDLAYELNFRYAYLQISPQIKFYMMEGLYASIGPQLGFILNRSNLTYHSNMPELGPDLQIQQSLREVLKGNGIVSISAGAGYDSPWGLSFNFRYILGLSDSLETLANGFYFIENTNLTTGMTFTIGYAIPFIN